MKKLILAATLLAFAGLIGAADFEYEFNAEKNPLDIFRLDRTCQEKKLTVLEPFDEVWILKNQNVNSGLMLWKDIRKGKIEFEGGLMQGGLRIYALYSPSTGKGVGINFPSANSHKMQIISTMNGKLEVLAECNLAESPRQLEVSFEITDDKIMAYDEGKLVCEAKLPAGVKRGSFSIMGTWGARIKLEKFSVKSPDLR
ncbi:MAG: hypothetical protein PHS41_07040 [Victivallaceae bacterium]|nr:hypothetical protein [Victivallaceae bacterium]